MPKSSASLAESPSPDHVTLILKNARHTVLLSVTKETSITDIARLLLLALQSRQIKSIANVPVPGPDHANLVEFGQPVDSKDLSKGFELVDGSSDSSENVRAGGKSNRRKSTSDGAAPLEGLNDGKVLAFRFKSDSEMELDQDGYNGWNVEFSSPDDDN